MLKYELTDYGVHFELGGKVTLEEIQEFSDRFHQFLDQTKGGFCVLADFKGVELISSAGKEIIAECQKNARKNGMLRSVVIVKDTVTKYQFKTLARQTGIYVWERYIDASKHKNWEELAFSWLLDGYDPEIVSEQYTTVITE